MASRTIRILHKASHILYLLSNSVCTALVVYEVYLRISSGAWPKVPTALLLPMQLTGPCLVDWILGVDLVYSLSGITMLFYLARWFSGQKIRQSLSD